MTSRASKWRSEHGTNGAEELAPADMHSRGNHSYPGTDLDYDESQSESESELLRHVIQKEGTGPAGSAGEDTSTSEESEGAADCSRCC